MTKRLLARVATTLLCILALRLAPAVAQQLSAPNYGAELAGIDARISSLKKRVAAHPSDWLIKQHLGTALLERATLSGSLIDMQQADEVIQDAVSSAPKGSGPLLLAARFQFSVHRLGQASAFLDQIESRPLVKEDERLAVLALRADIAFQRGEYDTALAGYQQCETISPALCSEKLMLFYAKTGRNAEAEALSDKILKSIAGKNPRARAWVLLQAGIRSLQQRRYSEALERLREADASFAGWWLVREHIAEVLSLQSQDTLAIPIYQEVIEQTNLPQYLDALAECYERSGRTKDAAALFERADNLWQEQLKAYPESAAGHAVEHFLAFGDNRSLAVELAEKNFANRPGGDARVLLAEAYLEAGRLTDAHRQVQALMASPYRTGDAIDVALQTYLAVGDEASASKLRDRVVFAAKAR